mmetsp:Transcript_36000/g.116465  ORF Transcript_36000/g.116465 Transcript_36000/m.116465 type:complete len:425 (+) Transcript_36000:1461-2735(+)
MRRSQVVEQLRQELGRGGAVCMPPQGEHGLPASELSAMRGAHGHRCGRPVEDCLLGSSWVQQSLERVAQSSQHPPQRRTHDRRRRAAVARPLREGGERGEGEDPGQAWRAPELPPQRHAVRADLGQGPGAAGPLGVHDACGCVGTVAEGSIDDEALAVQQQGSQHLRCTACIVATAEAAARAEQGGEQGRCNATRDADGDLAHGEQGTDGLRQRASGPGRIPKSPLGRAKLRVAKGRGELGHDTTSHVRRALSTTLGNRTLQPLAQPLQHRALLLFGDPAAAAEDDRVGHTTGHHSPEGDRWRLQCLQLVQHSRCELREAFASAQLFSEARGAHQRRKRAPLGHQKDRDSVAPRRDPAQALALPAVQVLILLEPVPLPLLRRAALEEVEAGIDHALRLGEVAPPEQEEQVRPLRDLHNLGCQGA